MLWPDGVDISRWNDEVQVRLARFPDVDATIALRDLVPGTGDEAELLVDGDGRVLVIAWPSEAAAPDVVRLAFAYDAAHDHATILLRDTAFVETRPAIASEPLSRPPDVHLDGEGRLVGLDFSAASAQLPKSLLEALRERSAAATGALEAEPGEDLRNRGGALASVDHPAVTDEVATETFVFYGGLLAWETFAADLAEFAEQQGLEFRFTHRRGPLRGLLGVELTCAVTGRFSQITHFADYARSRVRLWRDGDVAG